MTEPSWIVNATLASLHPASVPQYIQPLMTVVCTIILIVGLIGNCLVPVVIWNNRDLRNSTNLFLINLSVADILVLCFSMPTVLVEVQHHDPLNEWVLGEFMCKLVPFVEFTMMHSSVLTILAISFERYYVITRPLRAGYTCTRMRALVIILAIWIFGSLSSSPMLFIVQYKHDNDTEVASLVTAEPNVSTPFTSYQCVTQANTFWPLLYFISAFCVFFFLPLIILVAIYTVIARHLVADPCTTSNHRMQVTSANASDNPNSRARRQVVAMLGTVVVFFFLCLLPFRIFALWIILSSAEEVEHIGAEAYYNVLNFCRIMLYINSAINPILYNVMSSKFRSAFLKALGFSWHRKRLLRHLSRQSTFNTTTTTSATTATSNSAAAAAAATAAAAAAGNGSAELFETSHNSKPLLHKYGRQSSRNSTLVMAKSATLERHEAPAGSAKPLLPSAVDPPVILRDSLV